MGKTKKAIISSKKTVASLSNISKIPVLKKDINSQIISQNVEHRDKLRSSNINPCVSSGAKMVQIEDKTSREKQSEKARDLKYSKSTVFSNSRSIEKTILSENLSNTINVSEMISIDKDSERTNIASKSSSGDLFSLVIWEIDKTYSIINCRDFVEDEEIQIDSIKLAKYKNNFLKAKVKKIDTKIQCERQLDLITRYNSNTDNTKKRKISIMTERKSPDAESLAEKEYLKTKIRELENQLLIKSRLIQDQTLELERLRECNNLLKESFTKNDIEKFISISKNFLNTFGSKSDLESISQMIVGEDPEHCILSQRYTSVKISFFFKNEVEFLLRETNISHTSVYRKIMTKLIPSLDTWSKRNGESMLIDFPQKIYAAADFVKNYRQEFNQSLIKSTLRQMCAEARREIKKSSNPNVKELKESNEDVVEPSESE